MTLRSLVADDVRHNRSLAIHWLQELGHETLEAVDGEDAWRIAQDTQLDLIITDIEMPRQSGLELIQHLREHQEKEYSCVPVVVMSSLQDALLEKTAIQFGATVVVHKPLDKTEFNDAVKKAIETDASEMWARRDAMAAHPDDALAGPISPTLRRIIDRSRGRS